MARIELRDATIRIKDGLSGTALINEATPGAVDTDVDIDTIVLNSSNTRRVPVGARFTVSTAGNTTEYTVTARVESTGVDEIQSLSASGATAGTFTLTVTLPSELDTLSEGPFTTGAIDFDAAPAAIQTAIDTAMAGFSSYVAGDITVSGASTADLGATVFTFDGDSVDDANIPAMTVNGTGLTGGGTEAITESTPGEFVQQTTNITFSPAWGTPTPADDDTITFQSNEVEVKIGAGNITYTENKEYTYELDRGVLDTVREGDEQPMDVTIDFVYEFVTTGTSEDITVVDALKAQNGAAEFVSSSSDACEPYAVDIEVEHDPGSCGGAQKETTTFPDFRYDTLEFNFDDATISATGRCNATQPTIVRSA
jgi:hypothetical protein